MYGDYTFKTNGPEFMRGKRIRLNFHPTIETRHELFDFWVSTLNILNQVFKSLEPGSDVL